MKKFLTLALVLGIAGLAGATLTMQSNYDGQTYLRPSDTITISIWGNGQDVNPTGWVFLVGHGSINGGTVVYPGSMSTYKDLAAAAVAGEMSEAEFLAIMSSPDVTGKGLSDLSNWEAVDGSGTPASTNGKLFDLITFHCEGPGDVTVYLAQNTDSGIVDVASLVIHQIPEPVTMLLLGLGGLFIRKR